MAEFRKFQQLSRELVETNAAICRLRPLEEEPATEPGKKTAEAIRQEIAREVDQLLRVVFQERRKTGRLDLEATEMAVRSALHRAGAAALSELLQFPAPRDERRTLALPLRPASPLPRTAHQARADRGGPGGSLAPLLPVPALSAPANFPPIVELDIENTEFSPGVRRMQALVGQEAPFDHGREQMKVLAGLEVTTKSVERTAEAIGADIAQREQEEIQQACSWTCPSSRASRFPPVCANGRDGSAGGEERDGGPARQERKANRPIRAKSSWDACSRRRPGIRKATRSAIPIPPPIPAPSKPPRSLANASIWKPGSAAGAVRQKKVVMGDGAEWIWNLAAQHFPGAIQIVDLYHARQHLWELARKLYPNDEGKQKAWMKVHQKRLLDQGENRKTRGRAPLHRISTTPKWRRRSAPRPTTLRAMRSACATPSSAANTSSSARASSKPDAKPWSLPAQTVGNVLDRPRSQRHPGSPLLHFSMAALRITGRAAGQLAA